MTMSDRLAVMKDGRIDQVGTPEEVYERPATSFVASFLGASNLLDARIEGISDATARLVLSDGTTITMPSENLPSPGPGVRVGVRPEKITLVASSLVAADANAVSGTLKVATFIGVSHQYTISGPLGAEMTVVAQNLGDSLDAHPGDEVTMTWRPEHTFAVPT